MSTWLPCRFMTIQAGGLGVAPLALRCPATLKPLSCRQVYHLECISVVYVWVDVLGFSDPLAVIS